MKLDRSRFFSAWRSSLGAIRDKAVVPAVEQVLGFAESDPRMTDPQHLAYVFATVHWETARTWRPIEERGRGAGRDYGEEVLLNRGQRVAYFGRGYVQLTWLDNYARMSLQVGENLVSNPDRACDPHVAWLVLSYGMRLGLFTGSKLGDWIKGGVADYKNARRVINGADKATEIALLATQFERAIREATREDIA